MRMNSVLELGVQRAKLVRSKIMFSIEISIVS